MGYASRLVKQLPTGRNIDLGSLRLTGDRILLRLEEPGISAGGLHIPDNANHDPVGVVVAVSARYGLRLDNTVLEPAPVVGDRVMFDPMGAKRVAVGGEHLILLREPSIFAVLGNVGAES